MNASQMPGRRSLSFVLTLAVAGFLMLLTLPRRGVAEPVWQVLAPARETMTVTLADEAIRPAAGTVPAAQLLTFRVTNGGSAPHEIAVVQTTIAAAELPVENSRVRPYTYIDHEGTPLEPELRFYSQGSAWSESRARGSATGEAWPDGDRRLGVAISPGQMAEIEVHDWTSPLPTGTRFVLFCNLPGHYQRGMYAAVTVS